MDPKALHDLVKRYHDNREFLINEEMTKQSLIVPFITALGYDPSSPREVRLEYTAEFTVNDGKRCPDRMDYAIFDATGTTPLLIIEAKPLGFDIRQRSPQLARYMSQMPQLRFGIITDGCDYLFYSDLASPNVMDDAPFFSFSLSDRKLDVPSVAAFLGKFSKAQFKTDKLVSDAEDANYRQQMVDRLVATLRAPESNEGFVKWLSDGIYQSKRTQQVMDRLGRIAKESVQPAILRTLSDDLLGELRSRMLAQPPKPVEPPLPPPPEQPDDPGVSDEAAPGRTSTTTEEELAFYTKVRDICVKAGAPGDILYRDTINYFNVSYSAPTKWFVRLFVGRRRAITTLVPVEQARALAPEFQVEEAPQAFGISRVYIDTIDQIWALSRLVLCSLEICRAPRVTGEGED